MTADRPFLFSKITGVLSYFGMNIVRAQAFSNRHGTIFDLIAFEDVDRYFEKNPSEVGHLEKVLTDVINGKVELNALLQGKFNSVVYQTKRGRIGTTIHFDDEFSKRCTIVEILAQDAFRAAIQDRVGYLIARLQYRRRTDYDRGSSRDRCVLHHPRWEKLPSELEGQLQRDLVAELGDAAKTTELRVLVPSPIPVSQFYVTSFSPVRMLYPCSTGNMNTRPSPISPVRAVSMTVLMASSTIWSGKTSSTIIFGSSVTLYSVPR